MYVILDGFTLGIGILLPFLKEQERNIAMSVILPNWDGNQTWLVLGGAALYGAFPLAFSTILPILYLPLLLMVLALLFRGVAFEFHLKTKRGRKLWDGAFMLGSLSATLIQGLMLGAFVQGFEMAEPSHSLQWLTPFSLFTGCALVCGYTLLGASRLILKTQANIQAKMYLLAQFCAVLVGFCLIIASVWTYFVHPFAIQAWDKSGYIILLPFGAVLMLSGLFLTLAKRHEWLPYWLTIGIFLCSYTGFIISVWPNIVPYSITITQAAAPASSLTFMLVGAGIMLPVLLFYTWYSYHIFRGKIEQTISY
jgi:cytochrome d ubiquinol oxidase subunit II